MTQLLYSCHYAFLLFGLHFCSLATSFCPNSIHEVTSSWPSAFVRLLIVAASVEHNFPSDMHWGVQGGTERINFFFYTELQKSLAGQRFVLKQKKARIHIVCASVPGTCCSVPVAGTCCSVAGTFASTWGCSEEFATSLVDWGRPVGLAASSSVGWGRPRSRRSEVYRTSH